MLRVRQPGLSLFSEFSNIAHFVLFAPHSWHLAGLLILSALSLNEFMNFEFAGIVYAHLFCACAACHFHHTWVVFVRHTIANTLKCNIFQSKHTKSWETRAHRTYYGIYIVPTQEVGGCLDALHRYYSLRCLVTLFFFL